MIDAVLSDPLHSCIAFRAKYGIELVVQPSTQLLSCLGIPTPHIRGFNAISTTTLTLSVYNSLGRMKDSSACFVSLNLSLKLRRGHARVLSESMGEMTLVIKSDRGCDLSERPVPFH